LVGSGSDGEFGWAEGAEGDDGGRGELREPLGDAWAAGPMAIFVPPAIFDEEQTVLDLPVRAHRGQELARSDAIGIEAGEKITRVGRTDRAVGSDHVPINTQRNLRAGEVQTLAKVSGVVQVEPDPAAIEAAPFFSIVSAAGGRSCAWPKHCCTASRASA
jgi:hypothetical protein